ncbi:MAG: hypothetical protein ACJ75S_06855 [Solirubrobacterales bacterium]|jgi:hypothetical protein
MKRTELKRKTPLRNRKAGLPTRSPMRRRAAKPKKVAEKRHLERVAAMPCIIPSCRKPGPSTVHHVRHKITRSGTFARVDRRVVPLCPPHHLHDHGPDSVEKIHEAGIFERFGVDLWVEAERLWEESCAA